MDFFFLRGLIVGWDPQLYREQSVRSVHLHARQRAGPKRLKKNSVLMKVNLIKQQPKEEVELVHPEAGEPVMSGAQETLFHQSVTAGEVSLRSMLARLYAFDFHQPGEPAAKLCKRMEVLVTLERDGCDD